MNLSGYIKNSKTIVSDSEEYLNFLKDESIVVSSEDWGETSPLDIENVFNDIDWDSVSKKLMKNNYVVLDDVLKEEYCDRLYYFGLSHNIREDVRPGSTVLNFLKEKKRWFSLLSNITDELTKNFKNNYRFSRGWQILFDTMCEGIGLHIDPQSDITMNLWVTPDENCIYDIDEYANGLVIFDQENPNDWSDRESNVRILSLIEKNKSKAHYIKHRRNRLVIFKSNLYHKTFCVHTKPGYENRRVSYAFLFLDSQGEN